MIKIFLDSPTLSAAINSCAIATDDKSSRPILRGINFRHGTDSDGRPGVILTATDSAILARHFVPFCDPIEGEGTIDFTIDAKEAVAAIKMVAPAKNPCVISIEVEKPREGKAVFHSTLGYFANATLFCMDYPCIDSCLRFDAVGQQSTFSIWLSPDYLVKAGNMAKKMGCDMLQLNFPNASNGKDFFKPAFCVMRKLDKSAIVITPMRPCGD